MFIIVIFVTYGIRCYAKIFNFKEYGWKYKIWRFLFGECVASISTYTLKKKNKNIFHQSVAINMQSKIITII